MIQGDRRADSQRFHLSVHEHVWLKIAGGNGALADIAVLELVNMAIDAGFGSDKAECVSDIVVSMGGTVVRGRIIARLRKVGLSTGTGSGLEK